MVHRAADDIPETLYDKIKGIVTFGDPAQRFGSRNFPEELQEKVLQNCNTGDPVSSMFLPIFVGVEDLLVVPGVRYGKLHVPPLGVH